MGADLTSADHSPEVSRYCIAIAEHSPLPMATVEGDRHIVRYANPAFCRLMEKPTEQLVGKPFDELLPDKDQCATMLARVFRTGKPESHTETENTKAHPVFWSYTIWPVQADQGLVGVMIQVIETTQVHEKTVAMNEALLLGSLRQHELAEAAENLNAQLRAEIEQRKEMEAALKAAKEAAEAANRSKDRFLALLSHELRTPLTPVLMAVAALEHDPELRRDVREDMVMIKRNIEMEVRFIDDLLDVSRIASGKVPLQLEPLDLNGMVREVCADHRSQLLEQDVRLELELGGDVGILVADPTRLRQVFSNVLRNAVKFTPGQGTIRVTSARLSPERCEVRVIDSGIGILAEVIPHIFEAFEQGDARVTRQFGGLGLGLTIAKALVELHGGSIRAESAGAGQGATFTIQLPGDHPAPVAAAPPILPDGEVAARLRLLIVEDHADTARALSRLLAKAGFVVSVASDVATALALAGRETFDLLISDLGLPDGTGFDVMAGLQEVQPLPAIAMSGYGADEDASRTRAAGFREHLVKPIEVPHLIAAIRRVMESKG